MLKWISQKLNLDETTTQSNKDKLVELPAQAKPMRTEREPSTLCADMSKTPVDRLEPLYSGGLPDDFWTILVHIPYTFGSNDLEEVRKSVCYQRLKAEYEAKLARTNLNTDDFVSKQKSSFSNTDTYSSSEQQKKMPR